MQIGFPFAGTLSRSADTMPQGSWRAETEEKAHHGDAASASSDGTPVYFRALSSISHGSLASAYQAIRAQAGAGAAPTVAQADAGGRAGAPAIVILSGQGVPGAMRAYEDVIS